MHIAVDDFRVLIVPPAQPLAAAVTVGHELALHGEPAPGADVVGGLSKAVAKHLQLGHRHGDAPAGQGEGNPQKQRCEIDWGQLPLPFMSDYAPCEIVRRDSHQKLGIARNNQGRLSVQGAPWCRIRRSGQHTRENGCC